MPDTDTRLSMAEQLSATYDKLETETPDADNAGEVGRQRDDAGDGSNQPPAAETAEAKAERVRDEAGRFAAEKDKPREKLTLKPKEAKDAAAKPERETVGQDPGAKVGGETVAKEVQGEVIPPPSNWSGKGKVAWERLPHPVKQELAAEFAKASETSTKLGPVSQVIAPYEQRFQQEFGGTDRALNTILDTWKFARQNPVDFVKQFVAQYRLDPQALGFGATSQQADPAGNGAEVLHGEVLPPAVQQRLAAVEGRFAQMEQDRQTYQQNQIKADIQAFGGEVDAASGTLAHPYFNDVRKSMGGMLSTGQAASLKDAYDMACWATPSIRVELQREAEKKAAADRKQAVEKAKRAGGSIAGHPGVARGEAHVKQSARADLEKNWDALEARV